MTPEAIAAINRLTMSAHEIAEAIDRASERNVLAILHAQVLATMNTDETLDATMADEALKMTASIVDGTKKKVV